MWESLFQFNSYLKEKEIRIKEKIGFFFKTFSELLKKNNATFHRKAFNYEMGLFKSISELLKNDVWMATFVSLLTDKLWI